MEENEITQEMIKSRLIYVKNICKLVWLPRPLSEFSDKNKWAVWNSRYAGTIAGQIDKRGRCCIQIFGKIRKASRLIWIYHYGVWPEVIDHVDGNPSNDDVANMRNVTQAANSRNRALSSRSTTGHFGVYADGAKFRAQISYDGTKYHLGSFDTVQEAVEARKNAEVRFGYHPNHGRVAA